MSRARYPSGLKVKEITEGTGPLAGRGTCVVIHYRLFLNHGDQVRSSYDDDTPTSFVIGKREVIAGLELGVVGMRVGGRRQLIVSPHLAYKEKGVPGVPHDAVLRLEVDLLECSEKGSPQPEGKL